MSGPEGMHIVLASASVRRRMVLEAMGLVPDVRSADVRELTEGRPVRVAVLNALKKAEVVKEGLGDELPADTLMIGCDTVVMLDGLVIGKQENPEDVRDLLLRMSGRTHRVISGLALLYNGGYMVSSSTTRVTMAEVSPGEAEWYARDGDWRGKAGGYSIQGMAGRFVREIRGSVFNVIGFPLELFVGCLEALGHSPGSDWTRIRPEELFPGGRVSAPDERSAGIPGGNVLIQQGR